ncbi:MAG TPA: phosphoribosyl-ATP diphosphatase [Caulobacteraceae bacterium]|nr:phosphoribosyl-ATP diphosphatase [Caulobacteraceae bacterium]
MSRLPTPHAETIARRPRPNMGLGDGRLDRLASAVAEVRAGARISPRTSKLFTAGAPKIAQKVIEEAAEVGIEAVLGDRLAVISESVDLLYNLSVLWVELDIAPAEIWREMDRREAAMGMAEKLPKTSLDQADAA